MKKRALCLVLFIISINLISASYGCANETSIIEDIDEINVGAKKTINGLGVGLIKADETPVFQRITAELIVDTKKVLLNNETSSEEIVLLSGEYTITLLNATNENAKIDVDGTSKTLDIGELEDIKNLEVLLVSVEEDYPWETTMLVGTKEISLSNTENPSQIVTINEIDYLLELFSASDTGATIKVKKCEEGNIIEIEEEENNQTTPDINETQENNETEDDISEIAEEDKCKPAGLRGENTYCDETGAIFVQKAQNSSCINNYECKTNYCKEKCMEKQGILTRILNWFKSLFSGE